MRDRETNSRKTTNRVFAPGKIASAIHAEGAAASIQLGHSGFFTRKSVIGKRPMGASAKLCVFTMSYCREMTHGDIEEKTRDFVKASMLAKDSGFDAIEIHAGHGYHGCWRCVLRFKRDRFFARTSLNPAMFLHMKVHEVVWGSTIRDTLEPSMGAR